jgi:hypothetical protein
MIMIAQQRPGVNQPTGPLPGLNRGGQPHFTVVIIEANLLSLIAPGHHVVSRSGEFQAQRSGHAGQPNSTHARSQDSFEDETQSTNQSVVNCRTDPFTNCRLLVKDVEAYSSISLIRHLSFPR